MPLMNCNATKVKWLESRLMAPCCGLKDKQSYSDIKLQYVWNLSVPDKTSFKGLAENCAELIFFFLQLHNLGLEKEILAVPRTHPAARNRYIYSRGTLHQLPAGVKSIIEKNPLISKSLLPLILREPFVRKKQNDADESVYNFFRRRLSEEVYMYMYM